ncbi:DUF1799 domain-containing protein [Pseudomonas abietaniphila]|uniref:DUF1799 domain-containing protein n=1 Tax=Pseudomonas abietaniphila TaxID=89065 RepID=UPI000A870039|nr:DUF1799 domain-containing protein [Pseudomonas abietaniphila]
MFGLTPEDVDEAVELWAINYQSFSVFEAMGTQWRMGMGGATGLDYQALPVVLDMAGLRKRKDRSAVFADLRIMEREALRAMADNREE